MNLIKGGEINEIATHNMGSLSSKDYSNIVDFEKKILSIMFKTFKEWGSEECKFYCWYDPMAGELRYSSIPAEQAKLPFRADIKIVHSIRDITSKIYQDTECKDGIISFDDLKEVEFDDEHFEEEFILDVFLKKNIKK